MRCDHPYRPPNPNPHSHRVPCSLLPLIVLAAGSTEGSGTVRTSTGADSVSTGAVLYVLPPSSYEYRHPEGTGKDAPPFYSAWFLGGFKASSVEGSATDRQVCERITYMLAARWHLVICYTW